MKNQFFKPTIVFLLLIATVLFSCSTDKSLPPPIGENSVSSDSNISGRAIIGPILSGQWGSVTGVIIPAADANAIDPMKIQIDISNATFSFSNIYYMNADNTNFRIDNIPAGVYTISITNLVTGANYSATISIRAGMVTSIRDVYL